MAQNTQTTLSSEYHTRRMHMSKKPLLPLFSVLLILSFCSICFGNENVPSLLGAWQLTDGKEVLVFEENGYGRRLLLEEEIQFSWELTSDSLFITSEEDGGFTPGDYNLREYAFEYSIVGDTLSLHDEYDADLTYKLINISSFIDLTGLWIRGDGVEQFYFSADKNGDYYYNGTYEVRGKKRFILWSKEDDTNMYIGFWADDHQTCDVMQVDYYMTGDNSFTLCYKDGAESKFYKAGKDCPAIDKLIGAWKSYDDVRYGVPTYFELFYDGKASTSDSNHQGNYYLDINKHKLTISGYMASDQRLYYDIFEDKLIIYAYNYKEDPKYTFYRTDIIEGEFDTPAMEKEDLIGYWSSGLPDGYTNGLPGSIEFFEDGSYKSAYANYKGDYSVDGKRHRMRLAGLAERDKTCFIDVEGDTMVLYPSNYHEKGVTYTRKR